MLDLSVEFEDPAYNPRTRCSDLSDGIRWRRLGAIYMRAEDSTVDANPMRLQLSVTCNFMVVDSALIQRASLTQGPFAESGHGRHIYSPRMDITVARSLRTYMLLQPSILSQSCAVEVSIPACPLGYYPLGIKLAQ